MRFVLVLQKQCMFTFVLLFGGLLFFSANELSAQSRVITDMAGRKVTVPEKVLSVFSSNPIGTTLVYCLNPDKLTGLNGAVTSGEKRFLNKKYQSLPVIGAWSGNPKTINKETLLAYHPDLILASPSVNEQIKASETIQEETGIPVVILDQDISQTGKMIRFVADLIGEQRRGEILASYADEVLRENAGLIGSIPVSDRKKVYYAEGPRGLQTDPPHSFHTEVIDIAGAVNVADISGTAQGVVGRTTISFEQVALWNPDLLFVSDNTLADSGKGFYKAIPTDPLWSTIQAVRDGKYYRIPTDPWDWFDRPPSINRLIGIKWAESILYPEKIKFNITEEVKKFYTLFYSVELSDSEVHELLYPSGK
jgi:iron complex transport system substrate-binding protein